MAGMPGMPVSASESVWARLWLLVRRAPGLTSLLVMALVGLGISIYLTVVHYQGLGVAFCSTTGIVNCNKVTSSGNSVLFGSNIPITIPGMLWFVVSGALAVVGLVAIWRNRREPARLRLAHLLWGGVGLVFVLYLVYAEIVLLHSLCEWCTVVHLLTLATFLVALNRWQQRGLPTPSLTAVPIGSVRRVAPAATNDNGNGVAKPSAGNGARRMTSANSGSARRKR